MAKFGYPIVGGIAFAIHGRKYGTIYEIKRSGLITAIMKWYFAGGSLDAKASFYGLDEKLIVQSETIHIPEQAGWYRFPVSPFHADPQELVISFVESRYDKRSAYDKGGLGTWRTPDNNMPDHELGRHTPDNEFTSDFGTIDWKPLWNISCYAVYTPDNPLTFNLTVKSSPKQGIPFKIDGLDYHTNATIPLSEGDHLLEIVQAQDLFYFKEWSNGEQTAMITVDVDENMTLEAIYGEGKTHCQYRGLCMHTRNYVEENGRLHGRMGIASYYIPLLDQAKNKYHANLLRAFHFFLEDDDARWVRNENHTLETVEQIDRFLQACSERGIKVIFQLFVYPYAGGHWDDFDNAGWYNPESYDVCKQWLQDRVGPFINDSRILAWNITNEPYFRTKETSGVDQNLHIRDFLIEMARYLKETLGVKQSVTFGSLHPQNQYASPVAEHHQTEQKRVVADFMDIISFHAYGQQHPFESYGDPETIDPDTLTKTMTMFGKPVLNNEFGTPTSTSEPSCGGYPNEIACQTAYINECLDASEKYGILGTLSWGWTFHSESYPYNIEDAEHNPTQAGLALIARYEKWETLSIKPDAGDLRFLLLFLTIFLTLVLIFSINSRGGK